jgi:hypothetical protein
MNPKCVVAVSLLGSACALQAVACGASPEAAAPLPSSGDASYALPPAGDDSGDVFPDALTPVLASVRVAHASPDAPAFDVCVARHGTTSFQGPLLAQLAASLAAAGEPDAGPVGVSFSQVSAYVSLAPGQYDVRLVAAGASSCDPATTLDGQNEDVEASAGDSDAGFVVDAGDADADAGIVVEGGAGAGGGATSVALPDWVDLPALQGNTFATLLIAGDLTPVGSDAPIGVSLLVDDDELAGGAASLRAINALPSTPALDFGLGAGAAWMPLLTDVAFGKSSSMTGPGEGAVDANGYVPIPTFSGQAMSACLPSSDAGAEVATAGAVDVELGAIATVIAIGGKTGDASHPPALLICIDNQPSGGLLSDCSVGQ